MNGGKVVFFVNNKFCTGFVNYSLCIAEDKIGQSWPGRTGQDRQGRRTGHAGKERTGQDRTQQYRNGRTEQDSRGQDSIG